MKTIERIIRYSKNYIVVRKNLKEYEQKNNDKRFVRYKSFDYFRIKDMGTEAGYLQPYFWQDLWAARLINLNMPKRHYDIGSRIDGFIGHLSSIGCKTTLIDIRPLSNMIPDVDFICEDATTLKGIEDSSIDSLSALCSLEHFGLGRYGDPIDPNAWYKAMKSITRVLANGGHAYIAVPVGWEHLEYNAHRIFYASTVVDAFSPLKLVEYSVADKSGIRRIDDIHFFDNDRDNRGELFGLFHFVKE